MRLAIRGLSLRARLMSVALLAVVGYTACIGCGHTESRGPGDDVPDPILFAENGLKLRSASETVTSVANRPEAGPSVSIPRR